MPVRVHENAADGRGSEEACAVREPDGSQTGAQAARRSSVDICRSSSMVLVLAAAMTLSRIAPFSERGIGSETKLPFAVPDCRMARWW